MKIFKRIIFIIFSTLYMIGFIVFAINPIVSLIYFIIFGKSCFSDYCDLEEKIRNLEFFDNIY